MNPDLVWLLGLVVPDGSLRPSWFDVLALALTLLGLGLAWGQFRRTRTALKAEIDMQNSLEYNQLLVWIEELAHSLTDIEAAARIEDAFAAQIELKRFAKLCRQIEHNVGRLPKPDEDLRAALLVAGDKASGLKGRIATGKVLLPAAPVRVIHAQLDEASKKASIYLNTLRSSTSAQIRQPTSGSSS